MTLVEQLDESRRRQRDHHARMTVMHVAGTSPDLAAEDASYRDLVTLIPAGGKVLDVGACAGGAYPYLKDKWMYHGCDLLPESVAMLVDSGIPNIQLCPMEQLSYPDATFDVVFARHVLEHACDLPLALAEIQRVLLPGGVLAFAVPSIPHEEIAHYHILSVQQWMDAFAAAGFEILRAGTHPHHLQEFYGVAQHMGVKISKP